MVILSSFAILLLITLIYTFGFWRNIFFPVKKLEMTSLASSLNSFIRKGYIEDYQVNEDGLKSLKTSKIYPPNEIKIVDFHRFEGSSDPGDEAILYVIETNDNGKGTLVDAYGHYSD
ncbi:MAG TPA: hypothetical protein VK590_02510 [Saprospiraceae bacterium]|nr:hypothetical protein [Saprospiraceae bacterium]